MRFVKVLLIKMLVILHVVDTKYYLKRYPDVAAAEMDPVEHYVIHGFREGRSPNCWLANRKRRAAWVVRRIVGYITAFDADYYLMNYPDIASAGIDPLTHYARYGIWEGRSPNRKLAKHRRSLKIATALLSNIAQRNSPLQSQFGRELVFAFAQNGRRLGMRAAISVNRYLARRRGLNIYVRSLPVANLADEEYDWISIARIESAKPFSFHEPEIIGEDDSCILRTVEVPSRWIASISNATVVGGFQVVANDHFILYEPAGDPHNDFVAGSWRFVTGIKDAAAVAVWYEYENRAVIPEGILISGRCSPNYYHWLIEYLGRIYSVQPRSELHKVPLIIDASMYAQEFESLSVVCPNWPTYVLDRGTLLEVGKLHIPSIPTFLPDTLEMPFWKASALCYSTLAFLRETVFKQYSIENVKPARKIFLARHGARNITNTNEIEMALTHLGFECIDTGSLSFEEQVKLFADAAVIVGPLGAAFTNAIFCSPTCKVLGLASPYGKRFCMQANLATFAGCEYKILAGEHPMYQPGDEHDIRDVELMHQSFSVSLDRLIAALQDWLADLMPQTGS
jgi:capsular polysaccharide biosynthesis protein